MTIELIGWVCLTCAKLYILKQLIVVTFSWKTTIIYSKILYINFNSNLHMIEKL